MIQRGQYRELALLCWAGSLLYSGTCHTMKMRDACSISKSLWDKEAEVGFAVPGICCKTLSEGSLLR